jgi:hypothetical protein
LPMDISTYKALVTEKDFEPLLELLNKVASTTRAEAVRKCVEATMDLTCYSTKEVGTFTDGDLMWVKRGQVASSLEAIIK